MIRGLTYTPEAPYSFFGDHLTRSKNPAAAERLQRHGTEMDALRAERRKREESESRGLLASAGVEYRVAPGMTAGQGGDFTPPEWLEDLFATAPRPGRIVSQLSKPFPLPPGGSTVNVPVITTGSNAAPIPASASNTDTDITDSAGTGQVVMISGQADVDIQFLELSPWGPHTDHAIFMDLSSAWDTAYEAQLVYGAGGTGNTGQILGLMNVTNINTVTYTTGSPTGQGIYPSFGKMAAKIGDNRNKPPEIFMGRTARWGWLMSAEDAESRPFFIPGLVSDSSAHPSDLVPGSMIGWLWWCNDNIPATITAGSPNAYTGGTQDAAIACRPSDLILFEGRSTLSIDLEVLSGTLQARAILRNYAAAITNRYPSGISVLTGTGMAVQSGE